MWCVYKTGAATRHGKGRTVLDSEHNSRPKALARQRALRQSYRGKKVEVTIVQVDGPSTGFAKEHWHHEH